MHVALFHIDLNVHFSILEDAIEMTCILSKALMVGSLLLRDPLDPNPTLLVAPRVQVPHSPKATWQSHTNS